jgi:hypothetical protein
MTGSLLLETALRRAVVWKNNRPRAREGQIETDRLVASQVHIRDSVEGQVDDALSKKAALQ